MKGDGTVEWGPDLLSVQLQPEIESTNIAALVDESVHVVL